MSDEQQLPVPSEKVSTPVPRLSSPSQIQTHGLTAERAAKIVNQSGSSRMAALLGIAIVLLLARVLTTPKDEVRRLSEMPLNDE